jgi:uncharacterized protein
MIHSHLEVRLTSTKGQGIFVKSPIPRGELLMMDVGRKLSVAHYFELTPEERILSYRVSGDFVLIPNDYTQISPEWYVNHSCSPNTIHNLGSWYAKTDLEVDTEITHDYALLWMNDIEPFEINPCLCQSQICRGKMSGDDWRLPSVQRQYAGQFFPYMQDKIDELYNLS